MFMRAEEKRDGEVGPFSREGKPPGFARRVSVLMLLGALLFATAHAGTTGKISGRVLDKEKQPLPGANVLLLGTTLGAATDLKGYFNIINIPPGTYKVQFSMIGYQNLLMENVLVSSNNTTNLNVELGEETLTAEEIVVTAKRPVVEVNLTSSVSTVTTESIESLPVQELSDVVNLQAGVVDGHFRGGRIGEVQYQINGVTVNNPYDNTSTLRIDRSLLQEVQVISGTFDAEYGQAMSGVVNAVLKTGTDRFQWNGEFYTSDYMFTSEQRRGVQDKFRPFSLQNYQLSLSGPVGLPKTHFILSGRRFINDGYIYGQRVFVPNDRSNFETQVYSPTGDAADQPMEFSHEWSGLAKITNRSLPNIELSYQFIGNYLESQRYNFGFVINPEGVSQQNTRSLVQGLDWTHTLSKSTFYNLSLRQNYFDYEDFVYKDIYDSRYDAAGPSLSEPNLGWSVQGVELTRFQQRSNSWVLKGAVTSQARRDHLVKLGGEMQFSDLQFGMPGGLLRSPGGTQLERYTESTPEFPFQKYEQYKPIWLAAYGQDQIEWQDLIVRAGLRWEYFDARGTLPSDLQNPANAIQGAPASTPQATTPKSALAPRIGISYPISASAALFFAYGHFYQYPGLRDLFNNSNYSVLSELQAGVSNYSVFGNPDIKPERTVQYEFGYKHALTEFLGLEVSVFYKDIRDLLGVEFISTYAAAEYARFTNVDFGNVLGYTLSLDQRRLGIVSTMIDYTWQRAQGNSSDPRETATRASAGEDPRPRQVPLNWDQRHTLNTTVTFDKPRNYSISTIVRFGSGQPYTPEIGSGFGADLESNSGRKPSFVLIDVRAEKFFRLAGMNLSLFGRAFNLLDARFAIGTVFGTPYGFVFNNTGSPDYSLNPVSDRASLADPHRYYAPRRVEAGFTLSAR